MKSLILLLLLFASSYCTYIRPTNYNATLLNKCLGNNNFKLDTGIKELLVLFNQNRFFLFGKKCETMNLGESKMELLKDCFSKYGIYEKFASCPDCYDKCDYYQPNDMSCKKRCPLC